MNYLNDFFIRLNQTVKADPRFKEEAYLFVMTSIGRALRGLEKPRHITGCELLASIREEAEDQFGPMASPVLHHWGIKNSLDFGVIVFNMVRGGLLLKADNDQPEDFKDSFFFESLFNQDSGYQLSADQDVLKNVLKKQSIMEQ